MPANGTTPADQMEGVQLASGWKIGARVAKVKGGTGSNFGVCYSATRGEEKAFVKAIDFRRAFASVDLLTAVSRLAKEVAWEKDVLEFCGQHGLSRIVRLLAHEYVLLDEFGGDDTKRVSCLVMEVGDGDLRGELNLNQDRPASWAMFVIRDVALAIDQLHRKGIAHLDVKPSNVISMKASPDNTSPMKLGDLGRVVRKGIDGPFDAEAWPGDRTYQPPEKWYGYKSAQWNDERESADAFLVGSLLVFLFAGLSMGKLIHSELPDAYKPENYRGTFDRDLIDVLVRAQSQVLSTHLLPYLPARFTVELLGIAMELTNPDPTKRGDPGARKQGAVGMDRYHQKFFRIAKRLEFDERIAIA